MKCTYCSITEARACSIDLEECPFSKEVDMDDTKEIEEEIEKLNEAGAAYAHNPESLGAAEEFFHLAKWLEELLELRRLRHK